MTDKRIVTVDYLEEYTGRLNIPSVDQTYNSNSENAQSGKAVAQAVSSRVPKKQAHPSAPFSSVLATNNVGYDEHGLPTDDSYICINAIGAELGKDVNSNGAFIDSIPRRDSKGNLFTGTPVDDVDCANKKYVDDKIAAIPSGGAVDYELILETILDEPVSTVSFGSLNLKSILILMEITGTIGKGNVYTYVKNEKEENILYFPNMDVIKTSKRYIANELRDIGSIYLGLQNVGQWSFQDTNINMNGQYVPKNGEKITKCNIKCTDTGETFTAGSKFMIYGVRI